MIYGLATRLLHSLSPEEAHRVTIDLMRVGLGRRWRVATPELAVELKYDGGVLRFPNCVGLAAGFDKNAEVAEGMLGMGFGFVECGTVTPKPQSGNPLPRLFRLKPDRAVINRMGFNNYGLNAFAGNIEHQKRLLGARGGVIGANIGANKDSEDRVGDYVTGLKRLWGAGSYFTVNISSPNTPGLRALQGREQLDELLGRLAETRAALKLTTGSNYPILLKIAPDLIDEEIADTVESAVANGLDGLIVSNTTLSREGLKSAQAPEAGGLSGAPLFDLATEKLRVAASVNKGRLMLIGAGGIGNADQAYAKIKAGASMVQFYSALVYDGPELVEKIVCGLRDRLRSDGYSHISEAVGRG